MKLSRDHVSYTWTLSEVSSEDLGNIMAILDIASFTTLSQKKQKESERLYKELSTALTNFSKGI